MDETGGIAWLLVLIAPIGRHMACGSAESTVKEAETLDVEPGEGFTLDGLLCPI